jgi:hypothetical protein
LSLAKGDPTDGNVMIETLQRPAAVVGRRQEQLAVDALICLLQIL